MLTLSKTAIEDVLWIVDFGAFEPALDIARPGTGKIWVVRLES